MTTIVTMRIEDDGVQNECQLSELALDKLSTDVPAVLAEVYRCLRASIDLYKRDHPPE